MKRHTILWFFGGMILLYIIATAHCQPPQAPPVRTVCDCDITGHCTCYEGECSCPACAQTVLKETLAKLDRVTAILNNLEKRIADLEAKTATAQTSTPAGVTQPVQYRTYSQPVYAPLFGASTTYGQPFRFGGNYSSGVCFGGT